jgi:hypothetical protein
MERKDPTLGTKPPLSCANFMKYGVLKVSGAADGAFVARKIWGSGMTVSGWNFQACPFVRKRTFKPLRCLRCNIC